MTINVQQYEYVTQAGDTAGIMVGILPQYQMPFPEDDGVMVSPGHATSIAIIQVGLYMNNDNLQVMRNSFVCSRC